MNTKLTLNIDDRVIRQAKIYAKVKKRSVSKLVEEYLSSISKEQDRNESNQKLSPITSELLGMIKVPDEGDLDYKAVLESALSEKYS
jgi:hypothetical protein